MKLIEQSHTWIVRPRLYEKPPEQIIDIVGRTCYQSEPRQGDSSQRFCERRFNEKHMPLFEFGVDPIIRFVTNRGVTHEFVRHRLCSFAQESTRYCDYHNEMFFIKPVWFDDVRIEAHHTFMIACRDAERYYKELRRLGWSPQQAREVLPNALRAEIVVKANLREWRHIFQMRLSKAAHPQFRALLAPVLSEMQQQVPVMFDDLEVTE
jgi:thymidylate synthase (FAD)